MTTQEKNGWRPIESAPKDNKRALYLARFDSDGKLVELDFDGSWDYWQESWELSGINGWCWTSNDGIEDPTHWAYQDEPLPPVGVAPNAAPTVQDAVREAIQNVYDEGFGDAHKDPDTSNAYRAKTVVHAATIALLAKLAPAAAAIYEIRIPDSDTLNVWHEASSEAYSCTRAEDRRIVYASPQTDTQAMLRTLDQLANGTLLDEVNHNDDSLRTIAHRSECKYTRQALLAHAARVDAAIAAQPPQPGVAKLTVFDLDAAAKVLANCMGRPWERMPELDRAQLRRGAQAVIHAAIDQPPQWEER